MTLSRRASASTAWLALFSLVALAGLIALLAWNPNRRGPTAGESLIVYCAAGLQPPVAAAAEEYERLYGVRVQVQYGPSQTLLANIAVSRRGDLYVPADDTYVELARARELIDETLPLAHMKPMLAVRKGNPKQIAALADLKQEGVRLAQANPDAAAVGKLVRKALQKSGHWHELKARTLVFKPTVNEVANDIKVGSADAGFVWDATVQQYPELEAVPVPELAGVTAHINVAVLHATTQPSVALRFARFLTARDQGLAEFAKAGYQPADGDPWDAEPRLVLYAGAMLRPAIEETVTAFEQREGVRVERKYNGCGILVGSMKTGKRPDVYFACDKSFMSQVSDLFLESVNVSTNQLVILVPKGNPHGIHSLADLARPGLKIGVGHEKECALGALTQETLRQGGQRDPIMKNVAVQSPTGDLLVNQLLVGSLDAIIAYVSNATAAGDRLEAMPIDIPCAIAVQPLAVAKESRHQQLTARLMAVLRSRQSRERFEASGFHWQGAKP